MANIMPMRGVLSNVGHKPQEFVPRTSVRKLHQFAMLRSTVGSCCKPIKKINARFSLTMKRQVVHPFSCNLCLKMFEASNRHHRWALAHAIFIVHSTRPGLERQGALNPTVAGNNPFFAGLIVVFWEHF